MPLRHTAEHGHDLHGIRLVLRWIKRIALGLLALIALAVLAVVIAVHTDRGREFERQLAESQLAGLFTGGATIGKVEGSPFGTLVLRDVVINGPDRQPAISVGTLRVDVRLLPLIRKRVAIGELVVDDFDVAIKRDANGAFEFGRLIKPAPVPPKSASSAWAVDLPAIQLRRGHLLFDSGTPQAGVVDLDGLTADVGLHLRKSGAKDATLALAATWRERGGAPIAIDAIVHADPDHVAAPVLAVKIGDVALAGTTIDIATPAGRTPRFGGALAIAAPRAAVQALDPELALPDDVAVRVTAQQDGALALDGALGPTPITARLVADLDRKRVSGTLSTGELDLARLTGGAIAATGAAAIDFDVAQGAPGALPTAHATVHAHGRYATLPRSDLVLAVTAGGRYATATATVTGAQHATLAAALTRTGDAIALDRASLVASTRDPQAASGGKAPVRGALDIRLAAHGALSPRPALAITGSIHGTRLRASSLSIAALDVEIDAADLPRRPTGRASITARDIDRGKTHLGALEATAASRSDGWIDVDVTSHPTTAPQLVELAARVKPPGADHTTEIDILHHRVRLAKNVEWTGKTGRVVIGPEQITVRDLASASTSGHGAIALAGSYTTAGEHAGDATASVAVTGLPLASFGNNYTGDLTAHVAATRAHGLLAAKADVSATGLVIISDTPKLELHATIDAEPRHVAVKARATIPLVGAIAADVELAAPANVADIAAWRASGRDALTHLSLAIEHVDIGRFALLARGLHAAHAAGIYTKHAADVKLAGVVALTSVVDPEVVDHELAGARDLDGIIDGKLEVTATGAGGVIHARHVKAQPLAAYGAVDADLALAAPAPGQIEPTLAITAAHFGAVSVRGDVAPPAHVFDPAAWRALGAGALRGATIRVRDVAFDPGMIAKLGVTSSLRGHASLDVNVSSGATSAAAIAKLWDLQGSPIAKPVSVELDANVDRDAATATLAMHSGQVAMLDGRVTVPLAGLLRGAASLVALRADPAALRRLPIAATITIPQTSAPQLMAAFGRDEIVGGTMQGAITVAGTLEHPTATAHITADGLRVPPGPGGTPIKELQHLAIDAGWDGRAAKLRVDGVEARGGKLSVVATVAPGALAAATVTLTATAFDLAPVLAFAPGPAGGAAGRLDGNVTVTGLDPRTAQIRGTLHLADARVPIAPEVGTLRDANIALQIDQHDLKITAAGKLGAGTLTLDGAVALDRGSLTGGQAKLALKHVSPIGAIQPQIDAEITTKLARAGAQWTADVVIDHGFVKVDTAGGEQLKPVGKPAEMTFGPRPARAAAPRRAAQVASAARAPALIATVTLKPTPVESDQFRTTLKGSIKVVVGAGLDVKGAIDALGGDVDLFDRRYTIELATVTFDGGFDPVLAVRISHDFTDVTTVAEVRGRASKPELVLSANPGMYTQGQLLGFLLGGEPGGDTQSSSAIDKSASEGESFLANQIGGFVKSSIPGVKLDVLRYEAASANSSAAIAAGSWITHTLFFQYTQHLDALPDENDEEGTLEYWINHRLELQVTAGDRSYDGIDLLWRRRY